MTDAPTTVEAAIGQGRRCEYSQCGLLLPNRETRGPKYRYCPSRRWDPDNKTCREMAAAERNARRAVGQFDPLQTFRALTEQLNDVVSPLAELLAQVQDAVDDVSTGAL